MGGALVRTAYSLRRRHELCLQKKRPAVLDTWQRRARRRTSHVMVLLTGR